MSKIKTLNDLGWVGRDRGDPEVSRLRDYLAENNGISELEIVGPTEVDKARRLFYRDGFVAVADVLDRDQLDSLRRGVEREIREILELDEHRGGNRGSHRYSFGGASLSGHLIHQPEWAMLLDLPTLTPIVSAIFESTDYHARGGGGDFCLPGAIEYQPLHSDMGERRIFTTRSGRELTFGSYADPRGRTNYRDLPPCYIACNFLTVDFTSINGPIRQIPGTQYSQEPIPPLEEEPEWMKLSTVCPAPAGAVLIRDVRAWHGGTPNVSDEVRAIPNVEFYAPWFIEPQARSMPRKIFDTLSPHGQHVCRYIVADSADEVATGYRNQFGQTPLQ